MRRHLNRISRRRFLRAAGAAIVSGSSRNTALATLGCGQSEPGSRSILADAVEGRAVWSEAVPAPNLVPEQEGQTPSYWCTWGAQATTLKDPKAGGQMAAADNLNETLVFKDPGWLTHYFDKVRKDLFVVYDGGWDVPLGQDFTGSGRWRLGSFVAAVDKFPSCAGTPAERLTKLNAMTQEARWRGAGVWAAAQDYEDDRDGRLLSHERMVNDITNHARWSRQAGVNYWKCDYGARGNDPNFRRLVTDICREEAPSVIVEHARTSGPVNDEACPWDQVPRVVHHSGRFATWDDGRVLAEALELLTFSSVLRTYDVIQQFRVVSTLDRVAQLVANKPVTATGDGGLLLCEDQVYLGAGLGCAMGIMRTSLSQPRPRYDDPDDVTHRIDEVVRAVRWQRLAPAVPAWQTEAHLDSRVLMDDWYFQKGESNVKWLTGQDVRQGAPARVSRGMPLPTISGEGEPPYVIASRHPRGAISLATLPRVSPSRGFYLPLVDVAIGIAEGNMPVGIFGHYRSLTLTLTEDLGSRRVWAQDLAGDTAVDVSARVEKQGKGLILSGRLIDEIGSAAASPGDVSNPGLVLKLL